MFVCKSFYIQMYVYRIICPQNYLFVKKIFLIIFFNIQKYLYIKIYIRKKKNI